MNLTVRPSNWAVASLMSMLILLVPEKVVCSSRIVVWGDTSNGQADIPEGLTNIAAIAVGGAHVLALNREGTVIAWGAGRTNSGVTPDLGQSIVPAGLSNVISIAAGVYHSVALRSDGSVVVWGDNSSGQLDVPPGLGKVAMISAGDTYTAALLRDGTVVGWGWWPGTHDALLPGVFDVISIAAGGLHGSGLKRNSSVVTWDDFQAGGVPAGLTNVVAVSAGESYSLALKKDGTVVAWGMAGDYGPMDAPADLTNAVALASGLEHTLALRSDGRVTAWGYYYLNRTAVPLGLSNVVAVAAGGATSIVVEETGAPYILRFPSSQLVPTTTTVSFDVLASGAAPLTYQWRHQGTNIVGSTDSTLILSNVDSTDAGEYDVLVSNPYGTVKAPSGFLTIGDLSSALDATNLVWLNGGEAPWYPQAGVTHDGILAAQTGVQTLGQRSILQTTVVGPGTLSFWWKMSSTHPYSSLGIVISSFPYYGFPHGQITGLTDWRQQRFYLPDGSQSLTWTYTYTSFEPLGAGGAWLDQVSYLPGASVPTINTLLIAPSMPAGSNATLSVSADGTPPLSYQWTFNGESIQGATDSTLNLLNVQQRNAGTYGVIVSNEAGVAISNITTAVTPTPPAIVLQPSPLAQQRPVNGTLVLNVGAVGSEPFFYQWRQDGISISGATNPVLSLSNLQPRDSGAYSVLVSNAFGLAVSSNAYVFVVPATVVAWGNNSFGQTTTPIDLTNAIGIGGGGVNTAAVCSDGRVRVWGDNSANQTNVPIDLTNAMAIALGNYFAVALRRDGTVTAWGSAGYYGETNVPAGLSNVVAIAAGAYHVLALNADHKIVSWGSNGSGQTNVPPWLSNVVAVAAAEYYSLAMEADGTVVGWGEPNFGKTTPPPGLTNVVAVAAGDLHALALKSDGRVIGWGADMSGQTDIPSSLSNVVAIAAGSAHSLSLERDGGVIAWGYNANGATKVPTGVSNVIAIAGGRSHSIALMNGGAPAVIGYPSVTDVYAAKDVVLAVTALGIGPLKFQWEFNGAPIIGATDSRLILSNVPLTATGLYQCEVSNILGVAVSSPISLRVLRTQPKFDSGGLEPTTNGFALRLLSLSGHGAVVVDASTNLVDWNAFYTSPPVLGTLELVDPAGTNLPKRFYRAHEQ